METYLKSQGKKLDINRLKTPLPQYDPIVDSFQSKYTRVSIIPYMKTTGVIIRDSINAKFTGYCVENPLEVLEIAFPNYQVTRFNGSEFFGIADFETTTPMLGLSICAFKPVFGIEGKIRDFLELDEVLALKRDKPISKEDVQRIMIHLEKDTQNMFDPQYKQINYDKKQIIDVVSKYGQ